MGPAAGCRYVRRYDDRGHHRRPNPTLRNVILLSQPVRDDYRDLPLGTRQVAAMMRPHARVVRWPVIRWAGLHPFQAIVRDPRDPSRDPPIVPYHDLRTLASVRVDDDCDVGLSDVFDGPEPGDMFTINHPGNRVLVELSRRLQHALGRPADATEPGRNLLGEVSAPADRRAADGFGLPAAGRRVWRVGEREVAAREIHDAQQGWYRAWIMDAGYARHRATMETLGLA
jgi:hypothetical protein